MTFFVAIFVSMCGIIICFMIAVVVQGIKSVYTKYKTYDKERSKILLRSRESMGKKIREVVRKTG